jgi:murein DD-endopeptidase MepM/ murein hydrolase activator NlpD
MKKLYWPLKYPVPTELPLQPHQGGFGAKRKYDTHTGIDLYCEPNTEVVAIEDGVIVGLEIFTGPNVSSPWWQETFAVLLEGPSGVICYGEIEYDKNTLKIGSQIRAGETLGRVLTVLRKDKGKPMTMLHLELYPIGVHKSASTWEVEDEQPTDLIDPTPLLYQIINQTRAS